MSLPAGVEIRRFDPETAGDGDIAAMYDLSNELHSESRPDLPPTPFPAFIAGVRKQWPGSKNYQWVVVQGARYVGCASLQVSTTEVNRHSGGFWIAVRANLRRNALGTRLLREVAETAASADQGDISTWTNSFVPAGGLFLERIGGNITVEHRDSALDIASLEHGLLEGWLKRGEALSQTHELLHNNGPWPDANLDAICRMYEIMNTAPHQAVFEPEPTTPEHIRLQEEFQAASNLERWTMYVRPKGSEAIAGYTEVFWRPDAPLEVHQGDTAVAPEHRGKGLAIWLKATMLARILGDRPSVEVIKTGNATVNAPMLSINERLGFRYTHSAYQWTVSMESVLAYLEARP